MRKWSELLICAAMISFGAALTSCSDDDNGGSGGNGGNGGNTPELTPDMHVMAYYAGDYYEAGTGNVYINLLTTDISEAYDEYGEPTGNGTGTILCIDLNQALADDPDAAVLSAGTYTVDNSESRAEGTVNGAESYLLEIAGGTTSQSTLSAGSVKIESLGGGIYRFDCDFTDSNGRNIDCSYVVKCRLINRSGEGVMSNLDSDVEAADLTEALFVYAGDLYETGESDIYLVMLGDKDFDISTNYGPGNSLMLSLCVEPGSSDGIPAGTYASFVDIETAESLPVGSCIAGLYYMGSYLGCWYLNDSLQYEAALCGGSITVAKNGDEYTLSGTLTDGKGRSVNVRYSGTPVLVDDTQSAAAMSAPRRSMYRK